MSQPKTLWWGSRSRPLKGKKILEGREALDWLREQRQAEDDRAHPIFGEAAQANIRAQGESSESLVRQMDGTYTAVAGTQTRLPLASSESDTWECESMEVKGECPIFPKKHPLIKVPYNFYLKWQELATKHKEEWIAYLTGEWSPEVGEATVEDFYFPPQKTGAAHCEPVQGSFEFRPRTIGTVHSHVAMNAFFSGTDLAHMNWQIEMVINNKGEMAAAMRTKFKCGEWGRSTNCKVSLVSQGDATYDDALAEALKKGEEISAGKQLGNEYRSGGYVGHAWPE